MRTRLFATLDGRIGLRARAHPVRGQGRAHLSNGESSKPSIFFQPDVRTRAQ
jgi:hypothetical protein